MAARDQSLHRVAKITLPLPLLPFCQAEVLGPFGTGALMKQNQSLPCSLLSPTLLPNSQQGSSTAVLLGLNLSRAVFNHLSH